MVDDGVYASTTPESGTLISEMPSRINFLEEEIRRKDAILLSMTEAMKAINPPPEPRESPREATEEKEGKGGTPERPW